MDTNTQVKISLLQNSILLRGMTEEETETALGQLSAEKRTYRKGDTILHAGDRTQRMGMVLSGSVTIESNDMWGNRTILSHVEKGQFFAETYAWLSDEPLLVDAAANEDCLILFLRIGGLRKNMPWSSSGHSDAPSWQTKLLKNLLTISVYKNLRLSGRSFHTAPKNIRSRVMSYLNSVSLQKGCREFDIPFDRQQLADYLNVERTALSKELGVMQREGLLKFRRNHFVIIRQSMPEPGAVYE